MAEFDVEKIRLQLKRWQERLLDLSKSNPLLGINRARAAKLKIKGPNLFEIFQKLVVDESELRLPLIKKVKSGMPVGGLFKPEEQDDEEKEVYRIEEGDLEFEINTPADLRRKMRRIYDNSHTTIVERGVTTLYTAFGVICWSDGALGDSVSPILLVPCELISKGPNAAFRITMADDEVQINPAIIYYFREKHKINLPELPSELDKVSLKELLKKIEEIINEQGWVVSEEVWLGTFSFESLALYHDLKLLEKLACSNSLIAAFAHSLNKVGESSEALGDDLDSLETPEVVPVPILPADSSQLKALIYAASGRNLVIHGPPGTGKSQTISNIIADALSKNKKVLFVSAKMAALNVVFDRLKKEGLGQFCLEAHSTKAGKLKIIEELKRTLESEDSNNAGPLREELKVLQYTRKRLNEYVAALHTVINPAELSVFQAIGRFTKLQNVFDIKGHLPWENILDVSKDDVNMRIDALEHTAQMSELFEGRETHPWRGFASLDFNLQLQEQVETDLKTLSRNFSDISVTLERLNKLLPEQNFTFTDLSTITPALDAISRIKKLPENWWCIEVSQIETKKNLLNEASLLAKEFNDKSLLYLQFSDLSIEETAELLSEIDSTFKSWTNRITISYFKWKKKIKNKLKAKTKLGYKNIQNYYEVAKRLLDLEDWFKQNGPTLSEEVSLQNQRKHEVFEEAAAQCDAAISLRKALPNYKWENSKVTFVVPEVCEAAATIVSAVNLHSKSICETAERINTWWPQGFVNSALVLQSPFGEFNSRADEVLSNLNKLREWILLQRSIKHCEDLGLGDFLKLIGETNASFLPPVFEKRFLNLWINAAVSRTPCLADFSSPEQEELIDKFRILDTRIRRLAGINVRASAATASRKVKTAQFGLGNGGEVGTLRVEMQKRKRIKPLRRLFSEIPHVLQALKPCMLMSPISVSTYLKPETFHFDLVIFDEASQLPTPEAVPSILRANQVIVAGDPNQLPPTSFFDASLIEEDNDDYDEESYQAPLESLLDDCVSTVPVFQETPLKWHYRSRDERLINFSNHYFYENKLITFPSASTDKEGRGVRLEYVPDGVWDRGKSRTNRREARKAAELAIEHFTKFPGKSLGIVALNTYQREAIEDALSDELFDRTDLLPFFDQSRTEAFFVKSLESVQGDERDVIIISIGYGKNADGALTLNFGPLNMEGGWRRLNVLVTRAKLQIILLTSLRSAELSRVNTQNRGAVALKNYIEYAEREGSLPSAPARVTEGETNDFEDAVREGLVERGYLVDAQIGAGSFRIDLAIRDSRDPSKYLIGIECDGATYHSSRVARDRDLLREEILREMGWKLHRVWSTEWFQNRDMATKRMLDSIERALSKDKSESVPAASSPEDKKFIFKSVAAPKIARKYSAGIPYRKYSKRFRREILMHDEYKYRLGEVLAELVGSEGPIHEDPLYERLKEVFEVKKIGGNIHSNIEHAIRIAIRDRAIERKRPFICKMGSKLKTFRIPGDDVKRSICYISDEEISLAILYLVEDQFGMTREQIPQAITRVFEIARNDSEEADRIREISDKLIEEQLLVVSGNQVNITL